MKKSIYISILLLFVFVVIYFLISRLYYKTPGTVVDEKQGNSSFMENGFIQGLADAVNTVFGQNNPGTSDENSTQQDKSDDNDTDANANKEENKDNGKDEKSTEKTDLELLKEKASIIESYVSTSSHPDESNEESHVASISNIFVSSLVEFYGEEELKKTLNFESIKFSNYELINDNEATATAEVTLNGTTSTFKAYFYKQNNDWFLYKTE